MMKNALRGNWLLTGVFVLIAGLSGCAGSGEKSGAYVDDSWITSKVKSEMVANKSVKARDINVITNRGVVTLSGNTATWDESNKAAEIARSVKGVTMVENDIHVQ
jgi:osmotically-inducible protein OsmY